LTVNHGETLVVTFSVEDIDMDDLTVTVDPEDVELDAGRGEVRYTPVGDMVGTVTITLSVHDPVEPAQRATVVLEVTVLNVNDPPGEPRITAPTTRLTFKVNETFRLRGVCDDPDLKFGQELAFAWSSNVSGVLGTGDDLLVALREPGTHLITLSVSDGEYEVTTSIEVVIEPEDVEPPPPPPPDDGDDDDGDGGTPVGTWLAVAVVVAVLVVALLFLALRGRGGPPAEDAPVKEEEEGEAA